MGETEGDRYEPGLFLLNPYLVDSGRVTQEEGGGQTGKRIKPAAKGLVFD